MKEKKKEERKKRREKMSCNVVKVMTLCERNFVKNTDFHIHNNLYTYIYLFFDRIINRLILFTTVFSL